MIRYAAQMTLDVKVTDEVFDALREHFDTTQLVELTSAIATYNMVANGVQVAVQPGRPPTQAAAFGSASPSPGMNMSTRRRENSMPNFPLLSSRPRSRCSHTCSMNLRVAGVR